MARMIAGCSCALIIYGMDSVAAAQPLNDYPTATRVDYVLACMKANGDTRDALERCSCSIDVIATLLPHEQYIAAETVMSLAQVPGERGAQFRSTEQSQSAIDRLRRAQAEAEVRCF
ncbi:hypothetical protein [Geminicoccus sp.]|uniref:hypothetical protein n=1 Tax=Geminicoccus sp. TaxID=2024832 RepID=UPI0032C21234